MVVTLNKANLVLKDANGNIGKIEQLSDRDLAKIKTAVSDVALVVNQSNHTPIEATTTNKGVVQLATSSDVASGAIDKVVTAEQLHNATTGTSALAAENLARIDAVVTEAGIPIDHTNTNQLKTAVTTLVNNAVPSTATTSSVGVVQPDGRTITITADGVISAIGSGGGSGSSVTGKIEWFAFNSVPNGYLVCNGANVSRTTYADLFAVIGATFGSGDGSSTFTLPNLINKFAQGSTTVGTYKSAGLPNIVGAVNIWACTANTVDDLEMHGALHIARSGTNASARVNLQSGDISIAIDASRSSAIYGNSNTVQPPALTLLPCIKY